MTDKTGSSRCILVVAHGHREDAITAARHVIDSLHTSGARVVLAATDRAELGLEQCSYLETLGIEATVDEIDLAIVLGGDGTILRATELVREGSAPVLGVNMGHVGFLAELDRDDIDEAVRRAISGEYLVEERLALEVRVKNASGDLIYDTWALNEVTVEKASRERMLEVVIEIDHLPLSSFGADGVVVATPTGSTAYNFSAGGPVIWPSVEAIAIVPLSAHALFARPLVVGPETSVAIEVMARTNGTGILWADGRRSHELPPGARVVTRRSERPVRLAHLHHAAFTERLVRKFGLPVAGWRGPVETPTGAVRITSEAGEPA